MSQSPWYRISLGDGVAAFKPTGEMQETFMAVFMASGGPYDMAMFSNYEKGTNNVIVYFTPTAARVAEQFGAEQCEKPPQEGLGLLAGDQRVWQIHFPTSNAEK